MKKIEINLLFTKYFNWNVYASSFLDEFVKHIESKGLSVQRTGNYLLVGELAKPKVVLVASQSKREAEQKENAKLAFNLSQVRYSRSELENAKKLVKPKEPRVNPLIQKFEPKYYSKPEATKSILSPQETNRRLADNPKPIYLGPSEEMIQRNIVNMKLDKLIKFYEQQKT